MDIFNFNDGNGPVPAHKHPNGGGWVANTALVDRSVFVSSSARVFGNAKVLSKHDLWNNLLNEYKI